MGAALPFAVPPPPTAKITRDGRAFSAPARTTDERKADEIRDATFAVDGALSPNRWIDLMAVVGHPKVATHRKTIEGYFGSMADFLGSRPDLWQLDKWRVKVMRRERPHAPGPKHRGGVLPVAAAAAAGAAAAASPTPGVGSTAPPAPAATLQARRVPAQRRDS